MNWTLEPIADEPSRRQRDLHTAPAWGARLTVDQFLERERRLRQTPHARASMRTWGLRGPSTPRGEWEATAETFVREVRGGGRVEVVASVYVEPHRRGRGAASELMRRLTEGRARAGVDALVLFSEVGPRLYERVGFHVLPSPTREVGPGALSAAARLSRPPLPRLLDAADLECRLQRVGMQRRSPSLAWTLDLWDWHRVRAEFYASRLGRHRPVVWGAAVGEAWLGWMPDWKNDTLWILMVDAPPGYEVDAQVGAAARQALQWGLRRVVLWDDSGSEACRSCLLRGVSRTDDIPLGWAATPRGNSLLGALGRGFWA